MSGTPTPITGSAAAAPASASAARRRLPLGSLAYAVLAAALVALAATTPLSGYALNILMQAATYAIAVIGLTVVLGLCGQINLAQAGFFGIGAYAVGLGTVDGGLNFWICLVTGLGLAVVLGAALGASTLRLGGHYLAMVTISFQQILTLVLTNWIPVTHGPDGVPNIRRPALFADGQSYLALCVLVLAVVGWLVWHMPRTRLGRAMRAVRDNELAAGVSGIDIYRTKVAAFALGALLAGLGGGLFAGSFTYISPDQFSFAESIVFLTMALLGGVGSPVGAVIGTALLILIPEWLRFLKEIPGLYLAIYGLAVILIVVFMPDGIWGFLGDQVRRLRRARPAAPPAAELTLSQGEASAAPMLEVSGLAKHFGGLKAVDAVSFTVARGGIHALIGPNGSRQDHDAQRPLGPLQPHGRHRSAGRAGRHAPAPAPAGGGRDRAHLPEHPPVPLHERPGERRHRCRAAQQPARRPRLGDPGGPRPGGARLRGSGGAGAGADLRLLVWPPAPDRDRPGARRQSRAAPPRRARRGTQFQREERPDGAPAPDGRQGPDHPDHRPRHDLGERRG
ncbi:branched-chain amino acid transport system permease protein [Methylobacterium sp. OAE515]